MEHYVSFLLLRTGMSDYLDYDILTKTPKKGLYLNENIDQLHVITSLNILLKNNSYEEAVIILCGDIQNFEDLMFKLGFKNILKNNSEKEYYYRYYRTIFKNSF